MNDTELLALLGVEDTETHSEDEAFTNAFSEDITLMGVGDTETHAEDEAFANAFSNENMFSDEGIANMESIMFSESVAMSSFLRQVEKKTTIVEKKEIKTKVKESRGSLKRKVIGNGSFFETKLSKVLGEYDENDEEEEECHWKINSNKRYRKKICKSNAFTLGTVSHSMIPSSAGRRLCQVICALGNWNMYSMYFSKIPLVFDCLRDICKKDMKENGIESKKLNGFDYFTILRASLQQALCTDKKGEDYIFLVLSRYILQDKFVDSSSMNYSKLQSLLGAVSKSNKVIRKEFQTFDYVKVGPSKVALGAFNILVLKN